jgi:multisubunit Na+/H+ antiporter MnhB subunit
MNFHALIIGAMVLVVMGVMKEINNAPHTPNALMKVGVLGLGLALAILSLWTFLSWFQPPETPTENPAYDDGTTVSCPSSFRIALY